MVNSMTEKDHQTVAAMEMYGGHFVRALARLCHHADDINLAKIKAAWPEVWERYEELAAGDDAKNKKI